MGGETQPFGMDFYHLFQEHRSIMLLLDANTGDIINANRAAADFYGYSREELESMNFVQLSTFTPDEAANVLRMIAAEWKNEFVMEQRLASGEIRTVELYSCPHDLEGKTVIFSIVQDITEEILLAAYNRRLSMLYLIVLLGMTGFMGLLSFLLLKKNWELKEQHEKMSILNELRQTFIDADQSMIYLKDEKLRYLFVNRAMERFLDCEASDVIGRSSYDIGDRELEAMSRKSDLMVLTHKKSVVDQVEWRDRIFEMTKFPVRLMNGEFGVGAYIRDVTEEYKNKKELEKMNEALRENEEKLQLILDSTAEAIYGIDLEGNCTFCNASCLKILGYKDQSELIGKNMHWLIHHTRKDGSFYPIEECRIFQAFQFGQGVHVDNEVLWRADGTSFVAEYFSYPQYKDGKVVGAVVTFMDITARKKAEEDITYLSYHDSLTGLYNRRFVEEEIRRLDTQRNLPISVIIADVNGLKLTNDIFGHGAGDMLLKKAAESMRKACRADEIIARRGGDEFVIVLPRTGYEDAVEIAKRIKKAFGQEKIEVLNGSISMGCGTKEFADEDILQAIKGAEERMYEEKTVDRKAISANVINAITRGLYEKSRWEKSHADNVSRWCRKVGEAMGLSPTEVKMLGEAGRLHDIGKIVLPKEILESRDPLTDEKRRQMLHHPIVGYRILNFAEETVELAKYVLGHHERWDGSGYPKGLKGDEIPLFSRIISIVESYDVMVNGRPYRPSVTKEEAIDRIRANAGSKFDPQVVELFLRILREEEGLLPEENTG